MALGDKVGKEAVELLNAKTIPEFDKIIDGLVFDLGSQLDRILDRLSGATVTITICIPPRNHE